MKLQYRGSGKAYINEFVHSCDLYYNEKQGGIILKINVKNEKTLGSFLQVPLELPYLCGELENGFKFTLLRLRRTGMKDLLSYGITVFTFAAEYILCGIIGKENKEQIFKKINFTLSDIIEWGEESAFTIGEQFELISRKDEVQKAIYTGEEFQINYLVHGSMLPIVEYELLKEHIDIQQHGIIEISFRNEEKFERFIEIFEKLKRLIEIASFKRINVENVVAYSKDIVYTIGEKTIERPIEIYGHDIQDNNSDEILKRHRWKWIGLSELIKQNSFEHYFDKHETLAPIIELFLEPFYAENSSETRVFLNVVQALETYHSRFITNNFNVFKDRVKELDEKFCSTKETKLKEFLMAKSKSFITLESRLADLLFANGEVRFDIGEIKYKEFPEVIAHTRNYYIHYDERIKDKYRVLDEEELQFYNRSLLQMLEYYILLELGFVDVNEMKKKITDRWGRVSQDLELMRISREQNVSQ